MHNSSVSNSERNDTQLIPEEIQKSFLPVLPRKLFITGDIKIKMLMAVYSINQKYVVNVRALAPQRLAIYMTIWSQLKDISNQIFVLYKLVPMKHQLI